MNLKRGVLIGSILMVLIGIVAIAHYADSYLAEKYMVEEPILNPVYDFYMSVPDHVTYLRLPSVGHHDRIIRIWNPQFDAPKTMSYKGWTVYYFQARGYGIVAGYAVNEPLLSPGKNAVSIFPIYSSAEKAEVKRLLAKELRGPISCW